MRLRRGIDHWNMYVCHMFSVLKEHAIMFDNGHMFALQMCVVIPICFIHYLYR